MLSRSALLARRSRQGHLGLGAFHRAHQAAYTEAVLAAGDLRWGITAASLRSPETRDALAPQDGLYALNVRGEMDQMAVIGSVGQVLVAPQNPAALLDALCERVAWISSWIAEHFEAISRAYRQCRRGVEDKTSQLVAEVANTDTIYVNLGPERIFGVV